MSENNQNDLSELLLDYLIIQEKRITSDELSSRLGKIRSIQDLIKIDRDINDPLWQLVPQIAMYQFQLSGFKSLVCSHTVNQSFVFIHPLHLEIAGKLKNELSFLSTISREIDIILTEKVISTLYGGYEWYKPYARACEYLETIGKNAKIIILDNINDDKLKAIIDYKNTNRSLLAQRKIVEKEILKTNMDGIINSFHSPDQIENTRQMIGLGLLDINEISNV